MTSTPLTMPPTASCRTCGYSLHGLPSCVCPECGRAFDPDDPVTYRDQASSDQRRLLGQIRRWHRWCRPPSRGWCVAVVASTIFLLIITDISVFAGAGTPSTDGAFVEMLLRTIAVGLMSLAVIGRLRARRASRRLTSAGAPPVQQRAFVFRDRLIWFCCVLSVAVALWPGTLMVRFMLSRSALEAAARAQLQSGTSFEGRRRIGVLQTNGNYIHSAGQVLFNMTGWNGYVRMDERNGLLYEPHGRDWSGPVRTRVLDSNWSIAHFGVPYTIVDFLWDLLPVGRTY